MGFRAWLDKWRHVEFLIVGLLGIASVAATAYSIYRSRASEEQRFTAGLLREWNNDTDLYKATIYESYPALALAEIDEKTSPISAEEAVLIDDAYNKAYNPNHADYIDCTHPPSEDPERCKDVLRDIKKRDAIVGLINYLEYIAVVYELGATVEPAVEETFRGNFLHWFSAMRHYIEASNREEKELRYWAPFVRVACNWNETKPLNAENQKNNKAVCDTLLNRDSK